MKRLALSLTCLFCFIAAAQASPLYGVQVAAFREFGRAEELQMALEEAGYSTYFSEAAGYKRVRIGPYSDRAEADREARALWCFVVARFGPQVWEKPWVVAEDREVRNAPVRLTPATGNEHPPAVAIVAPEALPSLPEVIDPRARSLIEKGFSYLGTPYRWGGESEDGFDCSGFTSFIYADAGYRLPRTARNQFQVGDDVAEADLQPGDLVFFATYSSAPSHVGIYIGEGKFLHASSGPDEVTISPLSSRYY